VFELIGADWLASEVEGLTDSVGRLSPSGYNELTRYLPASVTSRPGYLRYDLTPYMREIVDCAGIDSPIREINLLKGVQIGYSTLLESITLYYADYIGTLPIMYVTADKGLSEARVENNFIPMFQQSGLGHIFKSADSTSAQKTGKTKNHLQFAKGGYLVPFGAENANKMRSFSIAIMLKDEVDAWKRTVGKQGDPDKLTDARTDGYGYQKKIFRGGTPLTEPGSRMAMHFRRGDQRRYFVPCKNCGEFQYLRWDWTRADTGEVGGLVWQLDDTGRLIRDSVRYVCKFCQFHHTEFDKTRLFSRGEWRPTATPVDPAIRSYHLPALYSPVGAKAWADCVADYLACVDVSGEVPVVTDPEAHQVFYNNVLGEPYRVQGRRVKFEQVDAHRRAGYLIGETPNALAARVTGGPILLVTCQVDVHKSNLAVALMGWTEGLRCFVLDYFRLTDADCTEPASPVWEQLRAVIEERRMVADDGTEYGVARTFIDCQYATDTVVAFCARWGAGVYPSMGASTIAHSQTVREFGEFTTQQGTVGYRIQVDHYKNRLAPVLRREWREEQGPQPVNHFNAPGNLPPEAIRELTVETLQERTDARGNIAHVWVRPANARNELWDLLVYGHACVEVLAWQVCIQHFQLREVVWPDFWAYMATPEADALANRRRPSVD
jgi:phage terminase large subunit GpA-like protein